MSFERFKAPSYFVCRLEGMSNEGKKGFRVPGSEFWV